MSIPSIVSHVVVLAAAATTAPAEPMPWWAQFIKSTGIFLPLAVLFVIMMTVMRGGKGKDKERELMLKQMKRGDRIQTIGGIMGTVMRTEESRVEVKVDEASNTKIWFTRSAIHRVLDADKAEVSK